MNPVFTSNPLYSAWPFWVLELSPSASNSDIEKAAREIESKLQFQVPGADTFASPLGKQQRDSFALREAKNALQDPSRRVLAEFWYSVPNSEERTEEPHNVVSTPGNTSPQGTNTAKPAAIAIFKTRSTDELYRSLGVTFWE